jgi:Ca-activated chloride channel family protein
MTLPFTFARPEALFLLLLPPALVVLAFASGRRRRAALARFGRPEALAALSTLRPRRRGRARLCLLGAVLLLAVALAGPRWGRGEPGVVIGRDLMVVLDLSKSMLADDMRGPEGGSTRMQRWQAARAGVHDLVAELRKHGGHRVGLVVFAAKPWLVCPLTADYDHFLMRIDEFSPEAPPRETVPAKGEQFPSGTRIGAAVADAIRWHDSHLIGPVKFGLMRLGVIDTGRWDDPSSLGFQDVLLVSDGDDPAPDADEEIEEGIKAARDAKVPVHVAGVGDPKEASTVVYRRADGEEEVIGPTKLQGERLKEIARQTNGIYLPAEREVPRLGEFFHASIEPRPSRELPEDALPQPRERYLWFLAPALVLLVLAWWLEP